MDEYVSRLTFLTNHIAIAFTNDVPEDDIFKSTVHRAVNRSGVRRYSIPLFFGTDYDVKLEVRSDVHAATKALGLITLSPKAYTRLRLRGPTGEVRCHHGRRIRQVEAAGDLRPLALLFGWVRCGLLCYSESSSVYPGRCIHAWCKSRKISTNKTCSRRTTETKVE